MLNYKREFLLPEGRVVIRALPVPLIEQTAELLAASFVTSLGHQLAPYSQYIRRNIVRYLREHQALPPKSVVLIAVLQPQTPPDAPQPTEGDGNGDGTGATQPLGATASASGQQQQQQPQPLTAGGDYGVGNGGGGNGGGPDQLPRVIGAAEVSCNPITRSPQAFLDAPKKCSYLSNMAVSPAFRRRGVATQLVQAAEEVAADVMGETEMFLHLRFVDKEAAGLYDRAGFQVFAQHWPIVPLLGLQRMKLMRKRIAK